MIQSTPSARLSRRTLVRGTTTAGTAAAISAAAAATMPALARSAAFAPTATDPQTTSISAMVVRADHLLGTPGAMRIGVRVSIASPGFATQGLVLTVAPVHFGTAAAVNDQIATLLRARVGEVLRAQGASAGPESMLVQLFGANL